MRTLIFCLALIAGIKIAQDTPGCVGAGQHYIAPVGMVGFVAWHYASAMAALGGLVVGTSLVEFKKGCLGNEPGTSLPGEHQ